MAYLISRHWFSIYQSKTYPEIWNLNNISSKKTTLYIHTKFASTPPPPPLPLFSDKVICQWKNSSNLGPPNKKPSVCHMYMRGVGQCVAEDSLSLLILPIFIIALLRNYTCCSVSKDTPRWPWRACLFWIINKHTSHRPPNNKIRGPFQYIHKHV